jgi:hypothetical protein
MREGFIAGDSQAPPPMPRSRPPQPQQALSPPPSEPQVVDVAADELTAAVTPPVEEQEKWPLHVKLKHRQILGNKRELLSEIVFREPTAADIIQCGNPVFMTDAGARFDERKMTMMMAQLSGVIRPLLDSMHPRDWNSCAYRLFPFFLPDWTSF